MQENEMQRLRDAAYQATRDAAYAGEVAHIVVKGGELELIVVRNKVRHSLAVSSDRRYLERLAMNNGYDRPLTEDGDRFDERVW